MAEEPEDDKPEDTKDGDLARTGFETAGLLGIALMLVIAGAVIVRRARRGNEGR